MTKFNKESEVTAKLTEDHKPAWVYFIDGVYFQQKGYATEQEAKSAGDEKLKELLKQRK